MHREGKCDIVRNVVLRSDEGQLESRIVHIDVVSKGMYFGEFGLIKNTPHSVTILPQGEVYVPSM